MWHTDNMATRFNLKLGAYMSGLITVFLIVAAYWFYKYKKQTAEIDRIKGLDIERKKIELMKLQGRLNDYKTSHVLHLLLSCFMLGLWIIPWFLIAQSNASKRSQIQQLIDSI